MASDAAPHAGQRPSARPDRGHEVRDHTADAGIHAWAPTLPGIFDEAAAALSALTVEVLAEQVPSWSDVEVVGHDLEGLAFAWLNELIGLAEVERRAVVAREVGQVETPAPGQALGRWRLRARVGLVDYDPSRVRALRHVKAATLHGLRVEERADGWVLDAVVDI